MRTRVTTIMAFLTLAMSMTAQSISKDLWQVSQARVDLDREINFQFLPDEYTYLTIDVADFREATAAAPKLYTQDRGAIISIPMPNGDFEDFEIFENNVLDASIKDIVDIQTFKGYSTRRPTVQIRCDINNQGFRGFIYDGINSYVIEPVLRNNYTDHIVYYKKNLVSEQRICSHNESYNIDQKKYDLSDDSRNNVNLKTFRLSLTSAYEYSNFAGGNPCDATTVLAAQASGVNMMNPIYERDLGMTFTLVTPVDLIFCDVNDPFDINTSNQGTLLSENITQTNTILGVPNYDVGHLIAWENAGGIAYAGVACIGGFKAGGFSGSNASITSLYVDFLAHEIGHQFNGQHNFVSQECGTSFQSRRAEPGEGSSIMAYAGVCGSGYQNTSNPYFHGLSILDINSWTTNNATCATTSTPGNGNANNPFFQNDGELLTIPKDTPFILFGSGSDVDGGTLTYSWTQGDKDGAAVTGSPDPTSTTAPLFKYQDPLNVPYRVFPNLDHILVGNDASPTWEKLPTVERNIQFNITVRDNDPDFGRYYTGTKTVSVQSSGPFRVTSPNGGESWPIGSTQTVSWDVNNTQYISPDVEILISTDGGQVYTSLAGSVTNNGTYTFTVPNTINNSNTARIMIMSLPGGAALKDDKGNSSSRSMAGAFGTRSAFFDVTNANFTIAVALPLDLLSFEGKNTREGVNKLNWKTTNEVNTSHFEVQRRTSSDEEFEVIGEVKSSELQSAISNYEYSDDNVRTETAYYRLKQIDLDGEFEFSDIISISTKDRAAGKFVVSPNPASTYLEVNNGVVAEEYKLTLRGVDGKIYKTQTSPSNVLNIEDLPIGAYLLETTVDGVTSTEKVVKTK